MHQIRLNGKHATGDFEFALVDEVDFEVLNAVRWKATPPASGGKRYAVRNIRTNGKQTTIFMHRLVMAAPKGMDVDHINHNPMDNRRENLRVVDRSTNLRNRKPVSFSGICQRCGATYTIDFAPSGSEKHRRYCGDVCRKHKPRADEREARARWAREQGVSEGAAR